MPMAVCRGTYEHDRCSKQAPTRVRKMTDRKRDRATRYFVVALVCVDDGIVAGQPLQCIGANAAIRCAQVLVNEYGKVGALALRKAGHEADRLHVLRAFGDVPYGEQINLAAGWNVVAREQEWDGVHVAG